MRIVGLTGKKRSGKDTAAAALVEQRGFVRVGFADAVKDLALRIDPFIPDGRSAYNGWPLKDIVELHGWEFAKTLPEVRRFLQELGTGVRGIVGVDAWTRAWGRKVRSMPYDTQVVVPDVRFINEVAMVRGWAVPTLLIRVERPGLDDTDRHVSETEMDRIVPDRTIVNDGTAADLRAKVLAAYDEWVGA